MPKTYRRYGRRSYRGNRYMRRTFSRSLARALPNATGKAVMGRAPRCPPDFSSNNVFYKTFRFQLTEGEVVGTNPITTVDLINLMMVGLTTATPGTYKRYFEAVRLMKVSCWAVPSATAWNTISLEWGGISGASKRVSATGDNVHTASIVAYPPVTSGAAQWINSGTTDEKAGELVSDNIFDIAAPVGSICDVRLAFTVADYSPEEASYEPVLTGNTGSSSTALIYYNYLDNTNVAGTTAGPGVWGPIGVASFNQAYGS